MTQPTSSPHPVTVAALYRFARLDDPAALRTQLAELTRANGIKGTLLLAGEGINGTVAGPDAAIGRLISFLRAIAGFSDLDVKFSTAAAMPFHRMKVRLKKEIVTMGVDGIDPATATGRYVDPAAWNDLIADPRTVVIDTRNDYEAKLGTFEGAVNPHTGSFGEFPRWLDSNRDALQGKKLAMYCTGGIRCEKATAYALAIGLTEVYHLKGGILKYLENIPAAESRWNGECFVFDERVAVGHGLRQGAAVLCRACRTPLTKPDLAHRDYVEGVSCPHCRAERSDADRARYGERHRQVALHAKRGKRHIGI
jgi:UPF0176 protein